jgi:rifampicin phosphotransferase
MGHYIIQFGDVNSVERALVGGKAASLGRLSQAGFPVPPGFTLAIDAYAHFMQAIGGEIARRSAALDYTNATQLEAQSTEIRALIMDTPVPPELSEAVAVAYATLGEAPLVAVRSSGTAEDLAEASFAGLHETYLDIAGIDAVLDAVKRCWASMWTARALHYRHDKGFSHLDAKLAVTVQRMIPAQVAGVLFTANPLNLRTDEYVINASYGLGEGVVSGILTPDEFVVDRKTLLVKARTCGPKELQIVRNLVDQGTIRAPVSPEQQAKFSLTDAQISELAALGRQVMMFYDGLPQDIEWTFADGQFYLLQARRVTGVEFTWDEDINDTVPAHHDDKTVWTSTWADDFLTGGVTPLYYSVRVGGEFQRVHDYTNKVYGFHHLSGQLIFKYRRATAFFNCDVEREWNILSLPSRLRNYDYVPHTWDPELRAAKFNLLRFLKMIVRLHVLAPTTGVFHWLSDKRGGVYHYLKHRIAEANGPTPDELRALSDVELERQIEKTRAIADEWVLTLWAGFNFWAVGALGTLAVALKEWYDGANAAAYQDLISGMPNTLMIQESRAQWHLANRIRRSPTLLALFREIDGPAFFERLPDTDEGRAFAAQYADFLREHGHRGHQDRDIYYTRRIEDRVIDYRMLRAYLAGDATARPEHTEQRLIAAREAATAEVLANIRRKRFGALKVRLFKWLLAYVHKFLVQRDDERHYYDRITYQTKKVFAEVGRRMFERGLFHEPDDFFFLAQQELYDLRDGRASRPLTAAKIAARKRVFHRRNRREEPTPAYLRGGAEMHLKARTETLAGNQPEGAGLRGLGTAVGRTTGIARIVPNLTDIGRVQRGDILVTNSTDPGWAPVFSIISGLVLETGGLLAHGACLSREYGLPSVLLRHAMNLLEDGALITIDGATGEVIIEQPPPEFAVAA